MWCNGKLFHCLTRSPSFFFPFDVQPKERLCRPAEGGNSPVHTCISTYIGSMVSWDDDAGVCYSSCPLLALNYDQAIEASIVQIFFNVRAGQSEENKDKLAKVCPFPAPPSTPPALPTIHIPVHLSPQLPSLQLPFPPPLLPGFTRCMDGSV